MGTFPAPPRHCPRDGSVLVKTKLALSRVRIEPEQCERCHGLFLDPTSVSAALGARAVPALTPGLPSRRDPKTPCPACKGEMREYNVQGTWLDACTLCRGVWFDPKELETLAKVPPIGPVPPKTTRRGEKSQTAKAVAVEVVAEGIFYLLAAMFS